MSHGFKVLVLNYEFPPLGGGAANATYYLLKEFSKFSSIEVDLVTSSVDKFKKEKFAKNITVHYLDIGKKGNMHYQSNKDLISYAIKSYKYSKGLMKNKKFDVCHAFFGIPSGYVAMKLGMPYIVSLRGSDVPFYSKRFYMLDKLLFKRLSRKIWKNAKAVIANSQGLKQLALQTSPDQEISVIYNGVDTEEFRPKHPKAKEKLVSKNKNITLVSTGRLIERKGYEYLIKALKDDELFSLNLIGDGNIKDELSWLAKEVRAPVNFLGKKSHAEINNYLQNADVFVLPSLNEGMSNSVLEAMSCGLPIITTDTGGTAELIRGNGFVVKKSSSEGIRKALEEYKNNPMMITRHSKISRKIAEKMSWTIVAKQYMEVYKE